MKKGFTLMELMVVIALIIIITVALLIALNPTGQINKTQDNKRKHELTQLNKLFEDFYNDKGCYPTPSEVCYNNTGGTTCNICGDEPASPSFSSYISRLPCDPRQPTKKYFYQVDSITCPTWYRIYTMLANQSDPIINSLSCGGGCGPSPDYGYNYGVSSPNISLETSGICSKMTSLYVNPSCNICGSYSQCQINYPSEVYYIDPGSCLVACIKD